MILESPFIKEFAEEFGEFFVKNMEVGQKLADDCIVEDLIEEANLTQQYSKITANASTEFKGETCNFYGLLEGDAEYGPPDAERGDDGMGRFV